MTADKPVIMLAHGAWHQPSLYDPLKNALEARRFELLVSELATMGLGKTGMSWDADVAMLLENAASLFDQGKSILLLGHSYGGIPASIEVRGNCVAERRAIEIRGGFSDIAFLSAFVMPARGMSALTITCGDWLPWHNIIELEAGSGGPKQLFVDEKPKGLLYNDFPLDDAQVMFDSLIPCSY